MVSHCPALRPPGCRGSLWMHPPTHPTPPHPPRPTLPSPHPCGEGRYLSTAEKFNTSDPDHQLESTAMYVVVLIGIKCAPLATA